MAAVTTSGAALLLLGDGRLPSGSYAHSGGLEATVRSAGVVDVAGMGAFLEGRAATTGYVGACFAAATCAAGLTDPAIERIARLDEELDARTPSPANRGVSRALGRQLLRTMSGINPHPLLTQVGTRVHQPVAYGVAAAIFELDPRDAAMLMLHESVAGPAAAAVKVLRTDPFTVHRALTRLTGLLDELALDAAEHARLAPDDLPALSSPLLDIAAEQHRSLDVRLFAS